MALRLAAAATARRTILHPSLSVIHQQQFRHLNQQPKGLVHNYRQFFNRKKNSKETQDTLFSHVVQLGDPNLRVKSLKVKPEDISTPQVQSIITALKTALEKYDAVGMSACQLGLPVQISAVQVLNGQIKTLPPQLRHNQGMEPFPLRILINPVMRVTDNKPVSMREGCCSLQRHSALVTRHSAVSITALDEHGEEFTWSVKGWTARIVQHEIDHLEGKVFTDLMKRDSFEFDCWDVVNKSGGDFKLSYSGVSGATSIKRKLLSPFNMFR